MINPEIRTDVVANVMHQFGKMLQAESVTGDEYMCILHNLTAHVLAENAKNLERDFFARVKTDVLRRRLNKLKTAQEAVLPEEDDNLAMTDAEKQAHAENNEYAINQGETA